MKTQYKTYFGVAVALIAAIAIAMSAINSNRQLRRLEKNANAARAAAIEKQAAADEASRKAEIYRGKIEYLNANLTELREITRRQDEEFEKFNNRTRDARGNVERTRSVRAIETTHAELCRKLADLGHPCE
ncbi:MAG: hypothetical protein LC734_05950 [Acidobacteria bacterium]|nr:hypothetical protein [Acidobacteriota bacterium]